MTTLEFKAYDSETDSGSRMVQLLSVTDGSLEEYITFFKTCLYAAQFHPDTIKDCFNDD